MLPTTPQGLGAGLNSVPMSPRSLRRSSCCQQGSTCSRVPSAFHMRELALLVLCTLVATSLAPCCAEVWPTRSRAVDAAAPRGAVQLTVEYMPSPLGVDEPHPRFGYQPVQGARGAKQTSYQLVVTAESGYVSEVGLCACDMRHSCVTCVRCVWTCVALVLCLLAWCTPPGGDGIDG